MDFKASFDGITKLITALVIILLAVANFKCAQVAFTGTHHLFQKTVPPLVCLFVDVVMVYCYLIHVIKYRIENKDLIIISPIRRIIIAHADIDSVWAAQQGTLTFSIRRFGSGGFFGYVGSYWSKALGSYTMYGTQRRNFVLIKLKTGKQIAVTPDDVNLPSYLI